MDMNNFHKVKFEEGKDKKDNLEDNNLNQVDSTLGNYKDHNLKGN